MTTKTWQDLAHPTQSAGQMVGEFANITEGTKKQIEFANDLRSAWIAEITSAQYISNVRYAASQERPEKLQVRLLARDAWNRRAVAKGSLNTNSAKAVIDFFCDAKQKKNETDMINNYAHIIQYPTQWNFNGKSWERVYK